MGRIANVTFACADPGRLAEFWAAVLDYEVQVLTGKTATMSIPIHLDVVVDDVEAEVARLEALGARVKERRTETFGPFTESWVVMADPEGNGFCLQEAR